MKTVQPQQTPDENLSRMDEKIQLLPYFQPIVSVASGRIVGYEALARQRDKHNRIVSAGNLFASPKLDAKQRIELDRQVRRLALQKFSELDGNSYLAINISAAWIDNLRQLNASPTLKMLDELNIDRQRIIVEITEAHADIGKLREIVKRYRNHGLRVALDDFGSGSSQLERVLAIHPDIIKIDMQLFKKASKGGIASDVVHMLTRLGKRTGCQIICEGVETDDEFLFGLNCGAQFMQGYLFSAAEAEFKSPTLYEQHIGSLRSKFFKYTVSKVQKNIKAINTTKSLIYKLKDALQGDFNLNELAKWNFSESNIARFYLCDNHGKQISPNFDFTASQWFTDPRKIGFNWSWRPYFFQLIALENSGDCERIVTSERYHDFDTDLLCKTLSLRLDADRILLVDIIVQD
jgi:EAL domain-containing protein (putative c-di-GMP-specific phosphodiesterase class I)